MLTSEEKKRVWELVAPLQTAMLVTCQDSALQARPMHLVQDDFNSVFYFFTNHPTEKTTEALQHEEVCLTFSCPKAQTYVSLSGRASLSNDKGLIDKFWNPFVAAWFPQGKDDPSVTLLAITCYQGEYWQGKGTKVTQLFKYAKAAITGNQPDIGTHEKLS
ncbi:MAG: pyridoxamine 5'-phosphate oxidase family protein [Legionella sp.]|nr:pyridoxamine 5'-phosphate oxidase family protein [Legionella sp.]